MTKIDPALERQLKRQALQLAAQLPDDPDLAAQVLAYAHELIEDFVRVRPKARTRRGPVTATGGPLRLVSFGDGDA